MKNLLFLTIFTISINCFSQTDYYSTNGKNRLTKTELDKKVSEMKSKIEKVMKDEIFISLKTQKSERKNDSIIHFISFDIKDSNTVKEPLTEFINKVLPKTELTGLNDKENSLPILNGKPTLINFWFTKCAPCIDEIPVLNKIKEKYKDDFNFIAITYNTKEDVEKFLEKHPFDFEHLINAKDFTELLGIQAYPMNLFLDKNGILKYVKGGIPYESKEGEELKMGEGNEIIEIIEKLK